MGQWERWKEEGEGKERQLEVELTEQLKNMRSGKSRLKLLNNIRHLLCLFRSYLICRI